MLGAFSKARSLADVPVEQPTKFELVINFTTAKALGLTIPETLVNTAGGADHYPVLVGLALQPNSH
jgi:hypothetical protein